MKRTLKLIPLLILILAASLRAELSQSPPGTVSIAIIPDTQRYRGKGTKAEPDSQNPVTNDVFHAYTSWIAENLETQRIIFVSQVGDIVDRNVANSGRLPERRWTGCTAESRTGYPWATTT